MFLTFASTSVTIVPHPAKKIRMCQHLNIAVASIALIVDLKKPPCPPSKFTEKWLDCCCMYCMKEWFVCTLRLLDLLPIVRKVVSFVVLYVDSINQGADTKKNRSDGNKIFSLNALGTLLRAVADYEWRSEGSCARLLPSVG